MAKEQQKQKRHLGNTDTNGTKKNTNDLQVFGNPDAFQLISKASSENQGFMRSRFCDLLLIFGFCLMVSGIAMLSTPAAAIVAGVLLIIAGLLSARSVRKSPAAPDQQPAEG